MIYFIKELNFLKLKTIGMKAITMSHQYSFGIWNKFTNLEKQLLHCGLVYFLIIGYMNSGGTATASLLPKGLFVALAYIPVFMTMKVLYYALIDYKPNTITLYRPGYKIVPFERVMTVGMVALSVVVTALKGFFEILGTEYADYLFPALPMVAFTMFLVRLMWIDVKLKKTKTGSKDK